MSERTYNYIHNISDGRYEPHTRRCELMAFYHAAATFNYWRTFWVEHPTACKKCKGTGQIWYVDYFDGPDSYDCPDCLDKGKCPWCGKHSLIDDDWRCRYRNVCGWHQERQLEQPRMPTCHCRYDTGTKLVYPWREESWN